MIGGKLYTRDSNDYTYYFIDVNIGEIHTPSVGEQYYQDIMLQLEGQQTDEKTGEAMKAKWYGVTAFYPAFQRVERQHQFVSENGGNYIMLVFSGWRKNHVQAIFFGFCPLFWYTFPVLMDSQGTFTFIYGFRAYPTTFVIIEDGSIYGCVLLFYFVTLHIPYIMFTYKFRGSIIYGVSPQMG